MSRTNKHYKYLVVEVDDRLKSDKVYPGAVMVDQKRHETDGWTSWCIHSSDDGSMSYITAVVLGKYPGPHGLEKGTPEYAKFQRTEATRAATMATKDRYLQTPEVRAAMAKLVADLEEFATECETAVDA